MSLRQWLVYLLFSMLPLAAQAEDFYPSSPPGGGAFSKAVAGDALAAPLTADQVGDPDSFGRNVNSRASHPRLSATLT